MRDSPEARFLGGICGISTAIAILVIGWIIHLEVANLYAMGSEGTLTVHKKTGEKRGYKGTVTRIYEATIANVPIQIGTSKVIQSGAQFPVLFLPEKLHKHRPPEFFTDYIIGERSETEWRIFIRDMTWPGFWIIVLLEVFMLTGGLWLLTSAKPKQSPQSVIAKKISEEKPTFNRAI